VISARHLNPSPTIACDQQREWYTSGPEIALDVFKEGLALLLS
jgi:hypothetical protein